MPHTGDPITALIKHAAHTRFEDIPKPVLAKTIDLLLDTVGCMLAGSSADGVAELRRTILLWGGNPLARILSFDIDSSPPQAAFLNSVMGHALDFDDTHDAALNHGSVTLVPVLLAVCEALRPGSSAAEDAGLPSRPVTGREFVAALAVGLDISNRLGMAFIPYLHVGWLPTTLWGPLACAAACGRLLDLDEAQMSHAFGLAYSQIHGNRQALADGALAKRIQPGFSAAAGLRSAFFAHAGLTGAHSIIGGAFGIPALYTAGQYDGRHLTDGVGTHYETGNISIKPYPSCRCSHPVIDAALSIREQHKVDWREISEAVIYLPPSSMGQIGNPFVVRDNPTVDAQFSAQYTAALAFTEGRPRLAHFQKNYVESNHALLALASKFKTVEFEKHLSSLVPIEMHIKLKGTRTIKLKIEHPKGSLAKPRNRQ